MFHAYNTSSGWRIPLCVVLCWEGQSKGDGDGVTNTCIHIFIHQLLDTLATVSCVW